MRISKPEISIPRPKIRNALSNSFLWQYRLFLLAGLVGVAGLALAIGGLVLVPMMAFSGSVTGVVAAAFMLAVGLVLTVGDYIWLTL